MPRRIRVMKIRLRLILLLGFLLVVFAAATGLLHESHRREAGAIRASVEQQRATLLDRLLVLTGQSLRGFANDYSLWDEMLAFVGTGDPAWARINIDASLTNFGVQGVWVLRPDGSQVYQIGELDAGTLAEMPFSQPAFLARLRREKSMHFYIDSPAGLIEVRTAPIQPSDDIARTSEPRGWLIATRLWSEQYLRTLAETLQSELSFVPPGRSNVSTIHLERPLKDWTGLPARTLHMNYQSLALERLQEGNESETYVLLFFGAAMILVTTVSLSRWVLAPLQNLGQSLERGDPAPLQPLHGQQSEFGHLARLVTQSFEHRAALEAEVRERRRIAEMLQQTEAQLRESTELRNRLARDLHDGVIQAVYAAGLGLEGIRGTLQSDPAAAERRLAGCTAALNNTIRDVRAFINGLEAESTSARPFVQTLGTLVATMQAIQPGNIVMEVDESVARRISPNQELQVLHILREAISNALRHADPRTIRLSLTGTPDGQAEFTLADDGCGFDATARANPGRGLVNLGIRARELGGTLGIDSAPGKGTRITLRFHPTYPP
jgi:signal transduction histidine kinase